MREETQVGVLGQIGSEADDLWSRLRQVDQCLAERSRLDALPFGCDGGDHRAKLEELLGVRLFERSARSIELTEAGREYMSRASGALDAIGSATDNARKGVRNALYVHVAPSFASKVWASPWTAHRWQRAILTWAG